MAIHNRIATSDCRSTPFLRRCGAIRILFRQSAIPGSHWSWWKKTSLYANSIGAYFSLLAFQNVKLEKSLFVSPILDMGKLIRDMMGWAGVTQEQLKEAGEIPTAFGETLSWTYLTYATENRITKWDSSTAILYARQDHLTARQTIDNFAQRFGCMVTVMENGEHWFRTEEQLAVLDAWLNVETE